MIYANFVTPAYNLICPEHTHLNHQPGPHPPETRREHSKYRWQIFVRTLENPTLSAHTTKVGTIFTLLPIENPSLRLYQKLIHCRGVPKLWPHALKPTPHQSFLFPFVSNHPSLAFWQSLILFFPWSVLVAPFKIFTQHTDASITLKFRFRLPDWLSDRPEFPSKKFPRNRPCALRHTTTTISGTDRA